LTSHCLVSNLSMVRMAGYVDCTVWMPAIRISPVAILVLMSFLTWKLVPARIGVPILFTTNAEN
jgi:hypothetical protein